MFDCNQMLGSQNVRHSLWSLVKKDLSLIHHLDRCDMGLGLQYMTGEEKGSSLRMSGRDANEQWGKQKRYRCIVSLSRTEFGGWEANLRRDYP